MKRAGVVGIVLCLVLGAAAGAVFAADIHLEERRQGVYGYVVDTEGNPVSDAVVRLVPRQGIADPLEAKVSKRGKFILPRVPLLNEGYDVELVADGWFVREFTLRARRGTREIWQEDTAKLTPNQQEAMPPLMHRGANSNIELTVMRIDEYQPEVVQAPGQGEAGEGAAPPPRELTAAEQAEEALSMRDFPRAQEKLQEALEESPDDIDLRWKLAKVHAQLDDTPTALREAMAVIRDDPERTGVRLTMAQWLRETGQTAAALPYLEQERQLDPDNPDVHKLLFLSLQEAGQAEDAANALEGWLAQDPENPEALIAMADIKAASGDFEGAEELFRKVAESDPENADRMFYNVGASIMNRSNISGEDRERAVAAFERALEHNPDHAGAHLQLGYALIGLGQRDKAAEHFRRFVELKPNSPEAAQAKALLEAL
jgi:tetratricopeptide (TPR) repeat protein